MYSCRVPSIGIPLKARCSFWQKAEIAIRHVAKDNRNFFIGVVDL
jgi:hypothetical protein